MTSPAHPSRSPRVIPRALKALSLAWAASLAACGGGGSSSGGDAAGTPPPAPVTAPAPSSDLAKKYIGTWSGCLWVQRMPGDTRNSWNRVTYTLTPDGGDRLSLSSTEERYDTDDCSGDRPTGVRTETATIRLDGTTLSITDGGETLVADRMIFASTGLQSSGDIPLVRGGALGIGLEVQLAAAITPEGLRVTRITGLSRAPTQFFPGVLHPAH